MNVELEPQTLGFAPTFIVTLVSFPSSSINPNNFIVNHFQRSVIVNILLLLIARSFDEVQLYDLFYQFLKIKFLAQASQELLFVSKEGGDSGIFWKILVFL